VAPVSRLGLGTATLGNLRRPMCGDRARAILATAWACGVRHFDTAPHYGLGLAERRLGSFLHGRQGFTVSTKVGRLLRPDPDWTGGLDPEGFAVPAALRRAWDLGVDGLRRSLEESLVRTGLDRVDVAYVHDPERSGTDLTPEQVVTGLVRLRDEGLVDEVGVASMTTGTLADYAATGALDVVMVAGRHTLLDQSAATEVFPHCRRHGTRVVAAAVFNSGLLSDPSPGTASLFDYAPATEELLERTRRVAAACREEGVTVTAAALQFPLLDPLVSHVVVGAAEPEHVRADVAALAEPVPASLWERLRETGVLR
jgi:D-threo-aldose 1-dehydrogenase